MATCSVGATDVPGLCRRYVKAVPVSDRLLISFPDCLHELEISSEASRTLNIKLPPARHVAKLWPQAEGAIVLPHDCQTTISDPLHALGLVLELLSVGNLPRVWRHEAMPKLSSIAVSLQQKLEKAGTWDYVVQRLLSATDVSVQFLVFLLTSLMRTSPSQSVQTNTAMALIRVLRSDSQAIKEFLLPVIYDIGRHDGFGSLHEEFQAGIATWLARYIPRPELPDQVTAVCDMLSQDNMMTDNDLQSLFRELSVSDSSTVRCTRANKRRKLDTQQVNTGKQRIVMRATKLLTGIESQNLTALPEVAPSVYVTLSERNQCGAWQALAELANVDLAVALRTTVRLIEAQVLRASKRPRVLSMIAIRHCLEQSTDASVLNLAAPPLGQLCLQSLHSSLRDLRIAAGRCLLAFVRDNLPQNLRDANRKVALDYLKVLSERDVPGEQETLVSVWAEIGLVCGEREMNLVLLQLVEYLGHTNPLVCGIAFTELEQLADAKGQALQSLFRPYWRTIAVSAVQDLHFRPQKAQQLCDLLRINVNQLLVLTQNDTVPTLVLTKRKDVLQRLATARGNGTGVQDLILQPRTNLAATMALLLSQPTSDIEQSALDCLNEVAPGFKNSDLSNLVKIDPVAIACEMLKTAGDQDHTRKSRAYQSFHAFVSIAERRPGQAKAHGKSNRIVAAFFEFHILGIVAAFSASLDADEDDVSTVEKVRSLRAIREMVQMAKNQVSIALPQLRACLHSAIEKQQLCEHAWAVWLATVAVLEADDIARMINQTFALTTRHWTSFNTELQEATFHTIGDIVKKHNQVMQEHVMTLPSLDGIPLLSKYAGEFARLRVNKTPDAYCSAFASRLRDESGVVVLQAMRELVPFLEQNQEFIHDSAISEQPVAALTELVRSLLDASVKYSAHDKEAAQLCANAIGIVGCVDSNRVEAIRNERQVLLLSNFDKADEVRKWVAALLEDVLVRVFKSVTNSRAQGFLAFVMQELLRFCNLNEGTALRPRASQAPTLHQLWIDMPEHVRTTLTPFLTSRYLVTSNAATSPPNRLYPSFSSDIGHSSWLSSLVYDLMWKGKGDNAKMVFPLLARIVRGHDLEIARFLLPYALLNVVIGGTVDEVSGIREEIMEVLSCRPTTTAQRETVKMCSDSMFSVLDYISTWLQEKRKALSETRATAYRTGHSPTDFDEAQDMDQIKNVETFLASIPAEVIADRAVDCRSFSRALFHWEQYIRQSRSLIPSASLATSDEPMYNRLHEIYAQIDEPDGLEGISAHLPFLSEGQQATLNVRAGRWSAAQAWYELQLSEKPAKIDLQMNLLDCLRETGQYSALLKYADGYMSEQTILQGHRAVEQILPYSLQACWMTGKLSQLDAKLSIQSPQVADVFTHGVARILIAARDDDKEGIVSSLSQLRTQIVQGLTTSDTASLQACHNELKKLHILHELETLSRRRNTESAGSQLSSVLSKRLDAAGSYISDKQEILGIRRAILQSQPLESDRAQIASYWLTTARLARKAGNMSSAYNAVLKAHECGDRAAKLEEARLLWHDGHQRQAIQLLDVAIKLKLFDPPNVVVEDNSSSLASGPRQTKQDLLSGKAHLLLAKWLDSSGQVQTKDMTEKYQYAARTFQRWEKGHYYLGKHYSTLLDAEKTLPKAKQSAAVLCGDLVKLVVENYLRSIPFGNKYWHQTIPKILTLWLDLGLETIKPAKNEDPVVFDKRSRSLQSCHKQLRKYFERVPAYIFYAALPQMISRISHPHPKVWEELSHILVRIAAAHPSQALWSLLAVAKATDRVRMDRGVEILNRLKDPKTKSKEGGSIDLRTMITHGQRLSDGLLQASEAPVEPRASHVSLSKDLGFNHKLAPSSLVVPIEATLTASVPSGADSERVRRHRAFAVDKITIQSFADDVLVLSSLQRPRKVNVRGSDGKQYSLLCKPKDDLRKDQRLMEFNGVINRALKKDSESSKRRLYIKTYAVIPLSEESGILEWVEGIKPIRDILLNLYARRGTRPNYNDIRTVLTEACANEEHAHLFEERVLSQFPPTLHEWFTETYPEPDTWFAARLRYARTAAVMSVTGHVLGLGDRHGENILLQEGTGGVFHVDFNCLFDKGLTFEKPEVVPFRLTHNMVDAMGPYGYEGPFRRSCELTLGLLRQNKDTLNTVLETFLYDPTTDFVGKKKKSTAGVPETPQEILDSVERKLKGLLREEKVPLSVEGYVDVLINEATSQWNLLRMYIGWCAFL